MDRSDVLVLVNVKYSLNDEGFEIPTDTKREVFCSVSSISRDEWYEAGRSGLNPSLKFTLFLYDYENEIKVIYDNKEYNVYRTYVRKGEMIELYVREGEE